VGGGGFEHPNPPPRYATGPVHCCSDTRNGSVLCEGYRASPVWPACRKSIKLEMREGQWWNGNDWGKAWY